MKIEKIKKVGKKYKIEFDNNEKLTTYDNVILENGLLYHKEVDIDLLNKLNKDHEYYDSYYKVIHFLSHKLRSQKEVIQFLNKIGSSEEEKEEILKKLTELGLVNDSSFAHAYAFDKFYLSTIGPYKIKKELLEHNIDEEIIDKVISSFKHEEIVSKMTKLIAKKVNHSKYSGVYLKQKIVSEMNNLGYDSALTISIFDSMEKDDSALLKKEYDKLYKKLSLKYQGKELHYKIKQKLYQKGFKLGDINQMIGEIDEL